MQALLVNKNLVDFIKKSFILAKKNSRLKLKTTESSARNPKIEIRSNRKTYRGVSMA